MTRSTLAHVARGETMRDILIAAVFGFWAVVLGLVPVLAIRFFG